VGRAGCARSVGLAIGGRAGRVNTASAWCQPLSRYETR
jgi:hypothetical protein